MRFTRKHQFTSFVLLAALLEGSLELGRPWGEEDFLTTGQSFANVQTNSAGEALEVVIPVELTTSEPATLIIEWGNAR